MNISSPMPFGEALAVARDRGILPTHLSTAELRRLFRETRQKSVFSARMTQARAVQKIQDALLAMLEGRANLADAKMTLLQELRDLGYTPEQGFPQDVPGKVPSAESGSLRDLSSNKRLEMIFKTQYRMAANYGKVKAETDGSRWQFPAQELVRVEGRMVPRGSAESGSVGWRQRWIDAGGTLYAGGRMIAAKGDPIWDALGNGDGGYDDAIGNPYPPFAFGSGMGWRDVPRQEAIDLGVITPDQAVIPPDSDLAAGLRADASEIDPAILEQFTDLAYQDGEATLKSLLDRDVRDARRSYNSQRPVNRLLNRLSWLADQLENNCGTGDGGFQPGNTCGEESGGKQVREFRVQTSGKVFDALGIEKGNIFADASALASKHPEYFKSSKEVVEHVDHVFEAPTHILPGNMPQHRLIVRASSRDRDKAVALEIRKKGGKYRVKSAYILTPGQLDAKMKKTPGQVVRLEVSRVNPQNRETPSRRLSVFRNTLPEVEYTAYIDRHQRQEGKEVA